MYGREKREREREREGEREREREKKRRGSCAAILSVAPQNLLEAHALLSRTHVADDNHDVLDQRVQ